MKSQSLRILGVVAHPHDFTHFAGTCGVHTSLGDVVTVVSVTDGAGTHNVQLEEEVFNLVEDKNVSVADAGSQGYSSQKEGELKNAAALFGVSDVRILGYPDKPFIAGRHPGAVKDIADIIREVRPNVLISQSPYSTEHHSRVSSVPNDHVESAVATLEGVREAGSARYISNALPHKIALTLFPGIYFNRDEWDFTIDIGDWVQQRIKAEEMYKSQGHTPEFARKRIAIGVGATGWASGTGYSESFVRSSFEVLSKISVSDASLLQASETEIEQLKRLSD